MFVERHLTSLEQSYRQVESALQNILAIKHISKYFCTKSEYVETKYHSLSISLGVRCYRCPALISTSHKN